MLKLREKASYETEASTFIYSLNARRTLSYIKDSGDIKLWGKTERSDVPCIFHDVQLEHNSLHVLTGPVNAACLHAVFAEPSKGSAYELRFSITVRGVKRLLVSALLGEYKLWRSGAWQCAPAWWPIAANSSGRRPSQAGSRSRPDEPEAGAVAALSFKANTWGIV